MFESKSSLISVWLQDKSLELIERFIVCLALSKWTMKINERENFSNENDTIEPKFVYSIRSSGDDVDGKYKLSSHRPQLWTSITRFVQKLSAIFN